MNKLFIFLLVVLSFSFQNLSKASNNDVLIKGRINKVNEKVLLYSSQNSGYAKIINIVVTDDNGNFEIKLKRDLPEIYTLDAGISLRICAKPGDVVSVDLTDGRRWGGDNNEINELINSFKSPKKFENSLSPEAITYSDEFNRLELEKLRESDVKDKEFLALFIAETYWGYIHKKYQKLKQVYGEIEIKIAPKGYFDFEKNMNLNDESLLSYSGWFNLISLHCENLEKRNKLNSKVDNYIYERASIITNKRVKQNFILKSIWFDNLIGYQYTAENIAKIEKYFLSERGKNKLSELKKISSDRSSKRKHLLAGEIAPDFEVEDLLTNKKVKLSDFKGKFVLIDMWFTGCGPCKSEMPHLKILENYFHGKNIEFLSLAFDTLKDRKKLLNYIKKHELCGVLLNNTEGFKSQIVKDYMVSGYPHYVIIDPDGKIVDSKARKPSDSILKKQLEDLLKM